MDSNSTQTINFEGSETDYSAEIFAQDVAISSSAGNHSKGSSKVKLKNVVDYSWEFRYYIGQLVACHFNGTFYAYTVKPQGKSGMIRVVNLETEERALIRDLNGTIQDIAFAFTPQVILGCIDNGWDLYVYAVDTVDGALASSLLIHVEHPYVNPSTANYRVIWCPYVPAFEENADTLDDPAKLLLLLNGRKAEVWDVSIVRSKYGAKPLEQEEDLEGYVEIDGHSEDIIDASFAPDGTAIATASIDGYVKFFQVYRTDSDKPRCLHQWQPHEGKPLSCLFFLDNIKLYEGTSDIKFWKFAITGANNNAEIKVWSCESWSCLQTIRFKPNMHAFLPNLYLKVVLDMTADYLIMSDITNQIMYVLQIRKNEEERTANFCTISEFLQPASILSFGIVRVTRANLRYPSSEELYEDMEEFEDDPAARPVSIRMIVVQPKSLQDCTITFMPEVSMASSIKCVYGNIAHAESNGEKCSDSEITKLDDLQPSVALLIQKQSTQPLTLMTPDEFTSPIVTSSPNNARSSVNSQSPTIKKEIPENFPISHISGASSPSREVEEILNRSSCEVHDIIVNNATAEELNPDVTCMLQDNTEQKQEPTDKKDDSNYEQWMSMPLMNIESMLKEQAKQIQELQMQSYKKDDDTDICAMMRKELDAALTTHNLQTAKLLEGFLKEQKRNENEQLDYMLANLSQHLGKQVQDNLQKLISHEIRENILPQVLSVFKNLENQLDLHLNKELNTIDQLLKANIAKLFSSKQVADSLSNSIVNVIKPSLDSCYKDMVGTALIPSWEKICNTMFQQIHTTFTQGTKEYTSSVESYMERQRKAQDKGKDLVNQIQSVSENMKSNSDKLTSTVQEEIQRQVSASFTGMQDKLSTLLADVVKENVRQGFRTHSALLEDSVVNAVRSRAVTPSPLVIDTQVQMSQLHSLITKGNIDAAFQQALSASATASDLSLVLYVCDNVSLEEVFGCNKCILQQHVLLSLVQQLGADLVHKTEVKQRYLQEAILNLDINNPMTREHVPTVLMELSKQLKNFILSNASNKHIVGMRMLLMATKSLIK